MSTRPAIFRGRSDDDDDDDGSGDDKTATTGRGGRDEEEDWCRRDLVKTIRAGPAGPELTPGCSRNQVCCK